MATIPSISAGVGAPTPSARGPRPGSKVVGYDPTIATSAAIAAANEKARTGIALAELGTSIITAGGQIARGQEARHTRKNAREYTSARMAFLETKVELDSSFDQDQDYATYTERYNDELTKRRNKILGGIEDAGTQQLFGEWSDIDIARGNVRMEAKAWAKEVDTGRSEVSEHVKGLLELLAITTNDGDRESIITSGNTAIIAAQDSSYITAQEEEVMQKKFVADYAMERMLSLPEAERVRLLHEAKKNNKTWVSYIPAKTRAKMLDAAEKVNKEDIRAQTAQDTADKIFVKHDNYEDRHVAADKIKDADERKRVKSAIDTEQARAKRVESQKYDELVDESQGIIESGNPMSAIGPAARVRHEENGDWVHLQKQYDLKHGLISLDAAEADMFYDRVARERFQSAGEILNWSYAELKANMPPDRMGEVRKWREDAAKAIYSGNPPDVDHTEGQFNKVLDALALDLDITGASKTGADARKRSQLRREMMLRRTAFQLANKRPSTHSDWLEMGAALTKQILVQDPGWWDEMMGPDEKPVYLLEEADVKNLVVPADDRARIIKFYELRNDGATPTELEIRQRYTARLRKR